MNPVLDQLMSQIAAALVSVGAVLTLDNKESPLFKIRDNPHVSGGTECGYLLQLHREPGKEWEPLSPFFFNLRGPDNPGKTGDLTPEIFDMSGQAMAMVAMRNEVHCTHIVGVPNAGKSFAVAFARHFFPHPLVLEMEKKGDAIGDFIGKLPQSGYVLGIDDLITRAKSKFPVIEKTRAAGLTMQHFAVLLDRKQGGAAGLAEYGVELHSVFDAVTLLTYAYKANAVSQPSFMAGMAYLEAEAARLAAR